MDEPQGCVSPLSRRIPSRALTEQPVGLPSIAGWHSRRSDCRDSDCCGYSSLHCRETCVENPTPDDAWTDTITRLQSGTSATPPIVSSENLRKPTDPTPTPARVSNPVHFVA